MPLRVSPGHPRHRAAQPPLPQAGAAVAGRDRAPRRLSRARREREEGVGVITLPDLRWGRCDIKSVSLLPNVLARQQAAEAGCREAWLLDADGQRHRGLALQRLHRRPGRPPDHASARPSDPGRRHPLGGAGAGARRRASRWWSGRSRWRRRSEAREALLSSTSSLVLPVTAIDGRPVANGMPGTSVRRLHGAATPRHLRRPSRRDMRLCAKPG